MQREGHTSHFSPQVPAISSRFTLHGFGFSRRGLPLLPVITRRACFVGASLPCYASRFGRFFPVFHGGRVFVKASGFNRASSYGVIIACYMLHASRFQSLRACMISACYASGLAFRAFLWSFLACFFHFCGILGVFSPYFSGFSRLRAGL